MMLVAITVIGFGLLQGSRLLDLGSGPYSAEPYAIVGIAAGALAYLYVAGLSYVGRLESALPLLVGSIVAMVLRIILIVLVPRDVGIASLMAQASGGVGWALSILCWMKVFASYRPAWSMLMIATGSIVNTLTVPFTSLLFPSARTAAFFVVIVLSFVALGVCLKHDRDTAQLMKAHTAPPTSMAELAARTKRTIVGIVVFSASCGFIVQMDISRGLRYAQTELTSILAVGAAISILLVLSVARPKKIDMDLLYPLSAALFMTVLLYRIVVGVNDSLSGPLVVALLLNFFCFMWMSFTSEAYERKLPGFFLLGLAVGSAQLSIAMGRLAALSPAGAMLSESEYTALAAVLWLLALSVVIVFVSYLRSVSRHNLQVQEVSLEGADGLLECSSEDSDLGRAALDLLRDTYSLSEREWQVVGEFSTGRSVRYIADYLILSEHTVKSHLRRAYAKMEVHSRQELLNLIERMEAELHRGA